jgi:hypothetical protein
MADSQWRHWPPNTVAARVGRLRRPATAALLLVLAGAVTLIPGCGRGQSPGAAGTTTASVSQRQHPATVGSLGAALLHPSGIGPGWRDSEIPPEAPPWPWLQADCPTYRGEDYPAQRHRTQAVQRRYAHDQSNVIATHVVEAYEPGWALRAIDDVRRVVETCAAYPVLGGTISFSVLESRFPAEDGLLVRGVIESAGAPPRVMLFVTVRRGELLSTLNFPDPVDGESGYQAATKLGDLLG